ncbi:signal peptidase I [Streptomyces coffeae]|uniref:signal peptidase I n=1 Tax=Streptomyces coffeae TaxID=621382 RepID=UPI0027DD8BC4|nr:signal peptidase I [Streptomyces coffeae]
MGDLAVGARSGHEEPERRPGTRGETSVNGDGTDTASETGAPTDGASGAPAGPGGADRATAADPSDRSGSTDPQDSAEGVAPEDSSGAPGRSGGEAAPGARSASGKGPKKVRSFWKELPILVGIALLLALLIKTFLVQAFSIPSDSMQNTLQRGDRVLVDKLTPWFGSEPQRGEVVVFHDPGGWLGETEKQDSGPVAEGIQKALSFIGLMPSAEEKDLIKRVIAVGGDTVSCKRGGKVMVNGKALDEPYIFPGNTPCDEKPFGPVKVPEGRIWVMGDHRQDSLDSRYHQNLHNGTVSVDDVVGRAIVVAWPVDRWSSLSVPGTFDQPGLSAAASLAPTAGGLAGALPIVLWRRRRLIARAGRDG